MTTHIDVLNKIPVKYWDKLYLVGGYLRDIILHRTPSDVDLVIDGPAMPIAEEISKILGGTLIVLDEERFIYRVVFRSDNNFIQLDLEGTEGIGLKADLNRRDFTINAMALSLQDYLTTSSWENNIIDPNGGLSDLARKTIRTCNRNAIESDPLRALRAFRFSSKLGFSIEPDTLRSIKEMHLPITLCAGERVWDELRAIFTLPGSALKIRQMDTETGLLDDLFPEVRPLKGMEQGGQHVDDAWEHSLKTLECFEESAAQGFSVKIEDKLKKYLEDNITKNRTRLPILKLGCLLHDVGKQFCRQKVGENKYTFYDHNKAGVPVAQDISQRLKLSLVESRVLTTMVGGHMDPLFLYNNSELASPRALRRFFSRGGEEVPGILLVSWADVTSTRIASGREREAELYQEHIMNLLKIFYEKGNYYIAPPKLLDGNDICNILNIRPSPLIGKILKALAEAQVEGSVNSQKDAVEFIKRWINKG